MKKFQNKQKAIDLAIWQNHNHRFDDNYGVVMSNNEDYIVVDKDDSSYDKNMFVKFSAHHHRMSYSHIRQIRMDQDPLPHWEEITGMISTAHGETLRFILSAKIPIEKFIRYELASRGYDKNFGWVGFEEAEKIWLK